MKKNLKSLIILLLCVCPFCGFAQSHMTSNEALAKLKEGNKRFAEEKREYPNLDKARLHQTAEKGQHPYATIIGCSDSRVPIEHIFDAGVGDLFIIRVAGNVVNTDEAGSIEYGVEHLHTPVLVVLGHSSCGAVTAVVKEAEVHGNIPDLVANIKPAVEKAHKCHGEEFSDDLLNAAIKNNVFQSIEDLFESSHVTCELVKDKDLMVVGAIYHLDTGEVEWIGEHPEQNSFINH